MAGDYRPLVFPFDRKEQPRHGKPVDPPHRLVLDWDDSYRIADQLGNLTVVPARPVRWIVVTSVKRERKGDWVVRFEATDLRQEPEFLGPGGTYTTSRFRAIDELEVVPRRVQDRFAKAAYDRDRALRLERVAAAQQDRWRFKRERRRAAARMNAAA